MAKISVNDSGERLNGERTGEAKAIDAEWQQTIISLLDCPMHV